MNNLRMIGSPRYLHSKIGGIGRASVREIASERGSSTSYTVVGHGISRDGKDTLSTGGLTHHAPRCREWEIPTRASAYFGEAFEIMTYSRKLRSIRDQLD